MATVYSDPKQRVALLESWKAFEQSNGTPEDVDKVEKMFPIVSKKRREDETGQVVEGKLRNPYLAWVGITHDLCVDWDMIFADDERESNPTTFKFLQMAHEWSQRAKKTGAAPSSILSSLSASRPAKEAEKPLETRRRTNKDEDHDATSDVASSHGDVD